MNNTHIFLSHLIMYAVGIFTRIYRTLSGRIYTLFTTYVLPTVYSCIKSLAVSYTRYISPYCRQRKYRIKPVDYVRALCTRNHFFQRIYQSARQVAYTDHGGSATVEFAVVLPAVVTVIVLIVSIIAGGALKLQTCHAAYIAVRQASIQHSTVSENQSLLPSSMKNIHISLNQESSWINATASLEAPQIIRPVTSLISCSATTLKEDDSW